MNNGVLKQIAMMALTVVVVIFAVMVAFKLLMGLVKLVVIGAAIGIGAVLALVFLYKINRIWRNYNDKPDSRSVRNWRD